MSNNKLSSVEYLYHKMVIKLCNKLQTIEYAHIFLEELEQAKAMHKHEMIQFALSWSHEQANRDVIEKEYNETFQ